MLGEQAHIMRVMRRGGRSAAGASGDSLYRSLRGMLFPICRELLRDGGTRRDDRSCDDLLHVEDSRFLIHPSVHCANCMCTCDHRRWWGAVVMAMMAAMQTSAAAPACL